MNLLKITEISALLCTGLLAGVFFAFETAINPALHRLRVIHLYESNYNLLLGVKLRQITHKCEDLHKFNAGTFGSTHNLVVAQNSPILQQQTHQALLHTRIFLCLQSHAANKITAVFHGHGPAEGGF